MSKDCWAWMYGHKKIEKAERAIKRDEDDVVFCLLMSESKKECKIKKVWFPEDVKQPLEASKMCIIDCDTLYLFMNNTCIGDSGASCHITNDDKDLYDIANIDVLHGMTIMMPWLLCSFFLAQSSI